MTYFISKKYQSKGYGTIALNLIILKLKKNKKIKIEKIFSQILETNIASQISCLKTGFIFQKILKEIIKNINNIFIT